uniref:DUF1279 domain-containing protein n=1 Tax=Eucampia antarctica TaxID=49252 RepID=A0A7S2R9E7_9STRA|mmetsp:Transcript_19123/g.18366  ORF Transcript_19123/g.18366 Transcript_19123/m.18366 type:complete len:340 (+) Transcript_19123:233-1252(+)
MKRSGFSSIRSVSTSLQGKTPIRLLGPLGNNDPCISLATTTNDDKDKKYTHDRLFRPIRCKQPSIQMTYGFSASIVTQSSVAYSSIDKGLLQHRMCQSSQSYSSRSFGCSFDMIRPYHSAHILRNSQFISRNSTTFATENSNNPSNRNKSVDSTNNHRDDEYSSPQQQESNKEKLTNTTKRGSSLTKKGAFSLIKKYGWTFIGTYATMYFCTLGSLFAAIDSGLLDPAIIMDIQFPWTTTSGVEDAANAANSGADEKEAKSAVRWIASYLEQFEFTKPYAEVVERNPHLPNLGIAWVVTKVTEPIRLAVTLAVLPRVSRFLEPTHPLAKAAEEQAKLKE